MNFFSRETTLNATQPKLHVEAELWEELLRKLSGRGGGVRESGAFLLGTIAGNERVTRRVVLYDDLDPSCLDEGYVHFDGHHYGRLWELCAEASLGVVADVHTHPFGARQSNLDRAHPMVSIPGHIALIVPNYASGSIATDDIGVYVYKGRYRWTTYRGRRASIVLTIAMEEPVK